MSPDRKTTSLALIEQISKEEETKIWNVIHKRAIHYAHTFALDITDEDDYQIALHICVDAYNRGKTFKATPARTIIKETNNAISEGLELRNQTIKNGWRIINAMKKSTDSNKDIEAPLFESLGIEKSLIIETEIELRDSRRTVSLPKTSEIGKLYRKRKVALETSSIKIFTDSLGIDPDNPNNSEEITKLQRFIDTPQRQAVILRGYLVSAILDAINSTNRHSPTSISHSAMVDLATNSQQLSLISENQRFLFVSQLLINSGFKKDEIPEIRKLLLNYFDNLTRSLRSWNKSSAAKNNLALTNPDYWSKLRGIFRGYPIDQITSDNYLNLTYERMIKANQEGSFHLWKYALQIDKFLIPSPQDLTLARQILTKMSPIESNRLTLKIKNAENAWRRYSNAKNTFPTKIIEENEKLAEAQHLLEELKNVPESFTVIRGLKNDMRNTERMLNFYKRAIETDTYIGTYIGEVEMDPQIGKYIDEDSTYFALSNSKPYIEILAHEMRRKLSRNESIINRCNKRLTNPNWLTLTHPETGDETYIDNPLHLKDLIDVANKWLMEVSLNESIAVPKDLNNKNRLLSFLALLSNKKALGELRKADLRAAIWSLESGASIAPLRRLFIADTKELIKTIQTLQDTKDNDAKTINYLEKLKDLSLTLDHKEKEQLIEELNPFFTKEREQQLIASYLPDEIKAKLSISTVHLKQVETLLHSYHGSAKARYARLIIPRVEEIDNLIQNERSKLINLETGKTHKSARRAKEFLDNLIACINNPFLGWKQIEGLTLDRAISALMKKNATAEALLNKDRTKEKLDELKKRYQENLISSKRINIQASKSKLVYKISTLQDEMDNAEKYLVESMTKLGFSIDTNPTDETEKS